MNLYRAFGKPIALAAVSLAALAADTRTIELALVAGKPEGGVRTVRVAQDETIALRVKSDRAATVHVHGYEVELRVAPGSAATVKIGAKIVGRFPVTLHEAAPASGRAHEPTLLYLEVHPK